MWFHTPYPTLFRPWKAVLLSSLIIFFILALFRPFGIAQMQQKQWTIIWGCTAATALSTSLFAYLLPFLFPKWHDERHWTIGRHILQQCCMLLSIAVGVWGVNSWTVGFLLDWNFLWHCVVWVLVLALFPTLFFLFLNQNLLLKRNLKDAMAMNELLLKRLEGGVANPPAQPEKVASADSPAAQPLLYLSGDTRDSQLVVKPSQLLYAESCGNYVKVVWLTEHGEATQSRLLRLTLKQLEEQTVPQGYLFRCHRAYLVNLYQVLQVSGNSQGCLLRLTACSEPVPVSRSYVKVVKAAIVTSD